MPQHVKTRGLTNGFPVCPPLGENLCWQVGFLGLAGLECIWSRKQLELTFGARVGQANNRSKKLCWLSARKVAGLVAVGGLGVRVLLEVWEIHSDASL